MASRLPFSKSHIERLGGRLIEADRPADEDLMELQTLLAAYGDVLEEAVTRVREATDLTPTARVKSTGTILEKLRRDGGSWLKSMQDLAGMRVVRAGTRNDQDMLVQRLVEVFDDETRAPRVIDRRAEPVHGYSAVHVIVFPAAVSVEIQVRTRWQHEWAELFEKLADGVGRGIRYGEPPSAELTHAQSLVTAAKTLAGFVGAVEELEATRPADRDLETHREAVRNALLFFRFGVDSEFG